MKIIDHVNEIKEPFVLTIGNFDGIHKGHQYLLKKLLKQSRHHQGKACVITFTPHPYEILNPERKNFLINSYNEKKTLIENLNIDYFVSLKFTRDFSTKGPETFIKEYLESDYLRGIYLGYDFSFGADKRGSYEVIQKYFLNRPVEISMEDEFCLKGNNVSSTRVRDMIEEGNFTDVTNLLGRSFFVTGVVLKGLGRGKQIGFPTANINVSEKRIFPRLGVYITETSYQDMIYHSITNVGINPTFKNSGKMSIETNIFDFDNEIYGERIEVKFLKRIREEKKFSSVNELVLQISKDIQFARKYHG